MERYVHIHKCVFKVHGQMWIGKIVREDLILARGYSFLFYKNDKRLTVINTRLQELRTLFPFVLFLETFFLNKIHKNTHEE